MPTLTAAALSRGGRALAGPSGAVLAAVPEPGGIGALDRGRNRCGLCGLATEERRLGLALLCLTSAMTVSLAARRVGVWNQRAQAPENGVRSENLRFFLTWLDWHALLMAFGRGVGVTDAGSVAWRRSEETVHFPGRPEPRCPGCFLSPSKVADTCRPCAVYESNPRSFFTA
jgi:hypothetical protein